MREKATSQLEQLAELAEPALRKALAGNPSGEARRRIEELLDKVERRSVAGEQLLALRALEVLEGAASPEARQSMLPKFR